MLVALAIPREDARLTDANEEVELTEEGNPWKSEEDVFRLNGSWKLISTGTAFST